MREEYVSARMEGDLKQEVEAILAELGLTPSSAIRILYKAIKRNGGMPFDIKLYEGGISDGYTESEAVD